MAAHDVSRVRDWIASSGSASPGTTSEPIQGLDEIIAMRVRFLKDYQDADYAKRYEEFVTRVRAAEESRGVVDAPLATAVARNLFKLMAVKDEYEVMRLWADAEFTRQLEHEFEGDYKIQFHLAPQMFFPRDPDTGRARKLTLSHRVMSILKLLRHLKFLRNTPFDPFNRTAHRRREWGLVGEYESVINEILEGLSMNNLELAVGIAEIPAQIRGFDSVKDVQLAAAKESEAILLRDFRTSVA
jgi:indolepyruvate ferredoxin oxidoreductase